VDASQASRASAVVIVNDNRALVAVGHAFQLGVAGGEHLVEFGLGGDVVGIEFALRRVKLAVAVSLAALTADLMYCVTRASSVVSSSSIFKC